MFRRVADNDGSVRVTDVQVGSFSPLATKFFAGLESDNSKDYWTANKAVFDKEVREPMAALVDSLPERLQPFKIFRMNRDIHPRVDLLRQKAVSAHRRLTGTVLRDRGAIRQFVVDTFDACEPLNDWIKSNIGPTRTGSDRR
jgi:Conserved hypothetical protein (DUF2461)